MNIFCFLASAWSIVLLGPPRTSLYCIAAAMGSSRAEEKDFSLLKFCFASLTVFVVVGGLIPDSRRVVIGGTSIYFSGKTPGLFPIRSTVAVFSSIACFGATNIGYPFFFASTGVTLFPRPPAYNLILVV